MVGQIPNDFSQFEFWTRRSLDLRSFYILGFRVLRVIMSGLVDEGITISTKSKNVCIKPLVHCAVWSLIIINLIVISWLHWISYMYQTISLMSSMRIKDLKDQKQSLKHLYNIKKVNYILPRPNASPNVLEIVFDLQDLWSLTCILILEK